MALGKKTAEFSGQFTGTTLGPGSGTTLSVQANAEGTVTGDQGEGSFVVTLCQDYEPGAKSGTYNDYGLVNMTDGTVIGFRGQGTWEESGVGKYRYRGTGTDTNGSTYAEEAETDLAAKTYTGKVYEWGSTRRAGHTRARPVPPILLASNILRPVISLRVTLRPMTDRVRAGSAYEDTPAVG